MKLRTLDLFSGIGGFSLGLERTGGFETVAFCEIDPFCRKVLAKHWPDVPIFEDVRELTADAIGPVDIITGGYPCQPFSAAGKRRGEEDDRHLWPSMYRLVAATRPTWIIGENVAGHVSMGLDSVLSDLENAGYACWPPLIPACAVDAKHRRDRVWIIAHFDSTPRRRGEKRRSGRDGKSSLHGAEGDVADTARIFPGRQEQRAERERIGAGGEQEFVPDSGQPRLPQPEQENLRRTGRGQEGRADSEFCRWEPEPGVGRVASGIPRRVDRLRALGNAVVPQVVTQIGHAILQAEAA